MMVGDGERPTKKISKASIRRILRSFKPYKGMVILTIVTVLVGVLFGLLPPWFLQIIIDQGITKGDMSIITRFSIYTLFATLIGAALTLAYGYTSVLVGQKIMVDLRNQLFDHLQGMSLRFFTSTRTGEIQSRLISDVAGVQTVVSTAATDALSNVAIVISTGVAMCLFNWRLTLLTIIAIPIFAVAGAYMGEYGRKVRKGTQEQTAELNSLMQETLSVSGVLLIKTSGRREKVMEKFTDENQKLAGWQIKGQVIQYVFFGLIRMIFSLTPVMVYWLAGYLSVHNIQPISVGTLVAFTALQTRMFFPLTGLMSTQVEIASSMALFDRIYAYLDMKQEIKDRPDAITLLPRDVVGDVTYEEVGFKYEKEQDDWTLKNITFEAKPGQLIALVGPSGAGKTTLAYLIPRLYDVDEGAVKIDGTDVRDIKLSSLGQIVGAVTQETYLVHTTVKENLKYAKPDATDEEIIAAAKAAAIHDHIDGLPDKYETVVGERGYKFSGGEKQRIAIARAILKNPRILILDEATSALDTRSERLIQKSLNKLMAGRTTFAIAHRLSTILAADLILVMQDGVIAERGKHDELLAMGGLYKRLYEEQFMSESHHEVVKT